MEGFGRGESLAPLGRQGSPGRESAAEMWDGARAQGGAGVQGGGGPRCKAGRGRDQGGARARAGAQAGGGLGFAVLCGAVVLQCTLSTLYFAKNLSPRPLSLNRRENSLFFTVLLKFIRVIYRYMIYIDIYTSIETYTLHNRTSF